MFLFASHCSLLNNAYDFARLSALADVSIPLKALKDSTIQGHQIQKDTIIIVNYLQIHHSETHWESPTIFKPERWLDSVTGQMKPEKMIEGYIPFSMGVRPCPGEKMARLDLFVFAARLILNFEFLPDPNEPLPDYNQELPGLTRIPVKDFKVIFKKR